MLGMLALLLFQSPPSIAQLDALAQKRDLAGVAKLASPALAEAGAFDFLRRNGVYDTGSHGWNAVELKDAVTTDVYVVFSTKLTSEDIGEQVFRWRNGRLDAYVPETDDLGFRVVRHDLDVRFDLPAKKAVLVDKATFRRDAGTAKSFLVRMNPWYRVNGVEDMAGKPVAFHQAGGVVSMAAPDGASAFAYTVRYSGMVDMPRYAGSVSAGEVMLTNDYWYPMIARQASPYSVTVHHPKDWMAVGQGERVSVTETPTGKSTKWRMDLPVVYYSLSVAPFKEFSETINGRRYSVWSLVMPEEEMRIQTKLFAPVIEYFDRVFGAYPFSGFGAVVTDVYGGGALEAYSFATYGTGWLPDEDAHEPAHTWWGGIVPNSYLGSLWNESFAVFSEGLYAREGAAGNREERRLAFIQDARPNPAFNAAPCDGGGASVGGAANGLGYGKGAYVLQMLEAEIGTETILKAMREWVVSHPKPALADWKDFEKVVARVSGKPHDEFFDQWLRRTGWADFDVTNVRWDGSAVVGNVVFNGKGYAMRLEAMVEAAGGQRSYTSMAVPATGGPIRIPMDDKPALVSFDPWRRMLRRASNDEVPVQISNNLSNRRYRDPARPDWLTEMGGRRTGPGVRELPEDLSGMVIIGSPETLPVLRPLCAKVGFEVKGDSLTWRGTTIDLRKGGALAVVELGDGKRCTIGLGKTALAPNVGRAKLALFDEYGRFLRGVTEPKTEGFLTARL